MVTSFNNGSSSCVDSKHRYAYVNGKYYKFKDKMTGKSITQINNEVFVDGYEIVGNVWKRTFRAIWHKYF